MSQPKEKTIVCMTDLPAPVRQAILDFLTLSTETGSPPEALDARLIDSITLKSCLSEAPRM